MAQHTQPVVYILHGWAVDPQNEQKWQAVRDILHTNGIRTVFVGLPGLTIPLPEEKPWTLDDYEAWLAEYLPGEPVILLGHSFGGQLAVRFTARHPERVSQLILIASSGIRDLSFAAQTKRRLFWLAAKVGKVVSFVPGARALLYKLAREKDYYTAPPVMRQTMSNVISEEILTDIYSIEVHTLLIWGSHDTITPVKNVQYFKKIPHIETRIISAARHSPQFTHPETVGQFITTFLDSQ